ncbi:MAG: hypothetical protein HYW65_04365 [Candidatus Liptonbacteria bacterium]|nr:hypothetical protein [Candidatus Liptonbacteria bacterium]
MLCRALCAGFAWWLLPFWLFFLAANALYWSSWFQTGAFLAPFLITLLLGAVSAPSLRAAVLIGAVFFLMLGAKEFVFIRRARAYELLGIVLLFSGALEYAAFTEGNMQALLPLAYLPAGILFFLLRESVSRYEHAQAGGIPEERRRRMLRSALGGFLVWEYGSVLSGLPLEYISKGAALFAGAAAVFFLTARTAEGNGSHVKMYACLALGVLAAALFSAQWTL